MEQFLELNPLLSGALQIHVAGGNSGQEVGQERFCIVGTPSDEEVVQAVNHTSSVKIVVGHHLVHGPHGAFEYAGVFLTLALPFPLVNPTA